jgi:hypothetical protein
LCFSVAIPTVSSEGQKSKNFGDTPRSLSVDVSFYSPECVE